MKFQKPARDTFFLLKTSSSKGSDLPLIGSNSFSLMAGHE
ncbi:hypothetical protein CEV33_2370 [Brucella grignonensis]|uniref:Uncharacterized protein n=1 Tax=Brucella grignonensis TaxID=94627 RepID=A0A256F7T4_9HYPH|nr:hypothetical protein CEV33_2370 [Brucella grignonensis]